MNYPLVDIDKEENHTLHLVGKDGGYVVAVASVYCDPLDETSYEYAQLIKDAFNVANESGLTPRQLLQENIDLHKQIKELINAEF